uniref:Uncharacterized protein n=1 Tax=Arundo donax TaxID=35708 RepID=A0A0A9FSQ9_ARUDO
MVYHVVWVPFAICDLEIHFCCDRPSLSAHTLDHCTLLKVTPVCLFRISS